MVVQRVVWQARPVLKALCAQNHLFHCVFSTSSRILTHSEGEQGECKESAGRVQGECKESAGRVQGWCRESAGIVQGECKESAGRVQVP